MKAFNVLSRSLAIVALSFTALAVSAKSSRTETVICQGSTIPSVSLKEVVVIAPASKHSVLCAMELHNGNYIPSVNLDEISVSASGAVTHKHVADPFSNAVLHPAVLVDGAYIANVDLNEVTVMADLPVSNQNEVSTSQPAADNNNQLFKVTMRQGFNRLLNFLIEKGKDAVASAFPALFGK